MDSKCFGLKVKECKNKNKRHKGKHMFPISFQGTIKQTQKFQLNPVELTVPLLHPLRYF